jgi:hypothetical protein
MKLKNLIVIFSYFLPVLLFGQVPQKMTYQAVVRDASGNLIKNKQVGIKLSILKNSPTSVAIYTEEHLPTTNENGLITLVFGGQTDFDKIDWSQGSYYLKTEVDPEGSSSYTELGTVPIFSVPYAFYAAKADSVKHPGIDGTETFFDNWDKNADNDFNGQYSSLSGTPQNLSEFVNDKGFITFEKDSSTTNEIQFLSISNDTIYLSNGRFVKLPAGFDGQYSSLTGIPQNLSDFVNDMGYLTQEKDSSLNNEIQLLSISNDTIYLSNGGSVKLPAGFDGQYSSLSGTPQNLSDFSNDVGYLTQENDSSILNEIQFLSISNDTIFLENGGFVRLPAYFDSTYTSLKDTPVFVSNFINDAGYLTFEKDSSETNEIQQISISNDTIFLNKNGGYAVLPAGNNAGEMRYWDGSSWTVIAAGQPGQYLQIGQSGLPVWSGAEYATLTTDTIYSITPVSAEVGGNISSNGGAAITSRGICYSEMPNPTLADSFVTSGTGIGNFSAKLIELKSSTTYYVRAFATNTAGTAYGNQDTFQTDTSYTIGSLGPAGGIVFYDKGYYSNGWRYLSSSIQDQSTGVQFGCYGTNIVGASGSGYGDGIQNTEDLLNNCSSSGIAASIAANFTYNGYSDWFLPGKSSLELMKSRIKWSANFSNAVYWSSTEASSTSGYGVNFYGSGTSAIVNNKNISYRVRAIRAF